MENKKNLSVDAVICDVRSVSEETLSAYEKVSINAVTLITSPEAAALLSRYHVSLDAVNSMTVCKDTRLSTFNGTMRLTPGQTISEEKLMLLLNGVLEVAPGSEEVLKSYAAIMVNGSVEAPESMAGLLSGITINGTLSTYPDGCIRLKRTAVLDRTFPLRARQDALYYAARQIIALAGDIDFGKLAEKNVRFTTKKLLIAEGLVEAALPLFDEKTDIQILPDGCAYLDDDVELSEAVVRRHGGKLYINGDLSILTDGPWLDQVTYLRVDGDVLAAKGLEDRLLAMDASYDDLYSVGGTLLLDKASVRLSRAMLEGAENGLSMVSCGSVTVEKEIPAQLLKEKLVSVVSCGSVVCTEEQRAVIEPLAQSTGSIGPEDEGDGKEEDPNTVKVDGVIYTL